MPLRRAHPRPSVLAASIVTAALVATGLAMPLAAHAATTVSNNAELTAAITASGVYELGHDIPNTSVETVPFGFNTTGSDVTIDVHGHALTASGITIAAGTKLTITDSVGGGSLTTQGYGDPGIRNTGAELRIAGAITVTATGAAANPGIGGTGNGPIQNRNAGVLTVTGSASVTANAGGAATNGAAGIGGAAQGDGGTVTIDGTAHVSAEASTLSDQIYSSGAGIGGGSNSGGGTVTIGGSAVVTARGGPSAAGIGGGKNSGFTAFTLGGTATVTAFAGAYQSSVGKYASSIGLGANSEVTSPLVITGGTWIIPSGSIQRTRQATLTNNGTIINHGQLNGPGTIVNDATIVSTDGIVGATVTHRNYTAFFNAQGGELPDGVSASVDFRAATIAAAAETMPTPTRSGYTFSGWRTAPDGGGTAVSADTDFTSTGLADANSGALPVLLYASWEFIKLPSTTTITPLGAVPYGTWVAVGATITSGATGLVVFSVDNKFPFTLGSAPTPTAALPTDLSVGPHTLSVSYGGDDTYLQSSDSETFTVAGIPTTTTASLSATSVTAGGAVSITPTISAGATGTVTISVDGASVGSTSSGSPLALPTTLAAGTHSVVATYGGDATHAASSVTLTLTVTAAPATATNTNTGGSGTGTTTTTTGTPTPTPVSTTATKVTPKLTVSAKKFARSTKPKITVTLSKLGTGKKASGTIAVYVGTKKVKTVTFSKKTVVKVTLPKKYAKAITVRAKYLGSDTIAAATSKKVTLRMR